MGTSTQPTLEAEEQRTVAARGQLASGAAQQSADGGKQVLPQALPQAGGAADQQQHGGESKWAWEQQLQHTEEPATEEELARQRQRDSGSTNSHNGQWFEPEQQHLPPPFAKDSEEVQQRIALVEQCLQGLQALGQGRLPEGCNDVSCSLEEWESQLQHQIRELADADKFEAGGPHKYYWVWHYLFKRAGVLLQQPLLQRQQIRWLLRLLRHGIKPQLVSALEECQYENRRHEERLLRFSREVQQLGGGQQLGAYLQSPGLQPVQFPNSGKLEGSRQLEGAEEFLRQTRDTLLQHNVLLPTGGLRPKVVHRLTVETKKDKWRLCMDALYLNLRSKAEHFTYEGLVDMKAYLKVLDYMITTDFKSGYHHFLLHPQYWTYFGVEILGEYFVFRALVFGWSPACQIFTAIMTVGAGPPCRQQEGLWAGGGGMAVRAVVHGRQRQGGRVNEGKGGPDHATCWLAAGGVQGGALAEWGTHDVPH